MSNPQFDIFLIQFYSINIGETACAKVFPANPANDLRPTGDIERSYFLTTEHVWLGKYVCTCNVYLPLHTLLGEVGATPKLLSLGIKKMGKETPGIISNGVFWKP